MITSLFKGTLIGLGTGVGYFVYELLVWVAAAHWVPWFAPRHSFAENALRIGLFLGLPAWLWAFARQMRILSTKTVQRINAAMALTVASWFVVVVL